MMLISSPMRGVEFSQIKSRVTLRSLLERDGLSLKRSGPNTYQCLCPIHGEKTPSFTLHEDPEGDWFKCFGCGAGGDIADYWRATRQVDFPTAAAALGALAGLSGLSVAPPPLPRRERVERPKPVRPMNKDVANRWEEGIQFLSESPEEQARIAAWRGYRPETVRDMVGLRLLGLPIYKGQRREGFPVWVPGGVLKGEEKFQAGFHVRTPDLEGKWRFEPTGIGSWPFVIGEIEQARALVVLEGQWDAIAFYDALTDGKPLPRDVAIVGIRGNNNWRKLCSYSWARDSQAFVFTDGDEAGESWLESESLAGELKKRCRAVHAFTWRADEGVGVKDFNDAHKKWGSRVSGDAWRRLLRQYWVAGLRSRLSRRGKGAEA